MNKFQSLNAELATMEIYLYFHLSRVSSFLVRTKAVTGTRLLKYIQIFCFKPIFIRSSLGERFPPFYVFLSNKQADTYTRFSRGVREVFKKADHIGSNPTYTLTDFERSTMNVIQNIKPQIEIKRLFFVTLLQTHGNMPTIFSL